MNLRPHTVKLIIVDRLLLILLFSISSFVLFDHSFDVLQHRIEVSLITSIALIYSFLSG